MTPGRVLAAFRKSYPGVDWRELELGEALLLLRYMGAPTQDILAEVVAALAGNGRTKNA